MELMVQQRVGWVFIHTCTHNDEGKTRKQSDTYWGSPGAYGKGIEPFREGFLRQRHQSQETARQRGWETHAGRRNSRKVVVGWPQELAEAERQDSLVETGLKRQLALDRRGLWPCKGVWT